MALLRMNRLGKMTTFPASLSVFNHAVCYLPQQGLWLDGTISFYDIKDIPPQDQDTVALILDDTGGRITSPPVTEAGRNRTEIEFEIFPQPTGGSRVRSKVTSHGNMAPELRIQMTSRTSPKDVFEKTINELFPGAQVLSFNVTNLEQPQLPLITSAEFFAPSLGKTNRGNDLEFPLLGRDTNYQAIFAPLHDRRSDLVMSSPWSVVWSIRWTAPPGHQPVQLPAEQKLQSSFGTAQFKISQKADIISIEGEFQLERNRIKLGEYPAFREFLGQVDHLFGKRLTFRREPHVSGS
jgi:cellulose synthase operon protein C